MTKQIEPNPSIADVAHSVIFSTPLLPAGIAAVVSSIKSAVFLLIVDMIFYFGNLLSSGKYADWNTVRTVLFTQLGYMLLRIAFAVSSIPGNPLTPLIDASKATGVQEVSTLVVAPASLPPGITAPNAMATVSPTDIHIPDIPPTDEPPYAPRGYAPIVNNPPPGRSGG